MKTYNVSVFRHELSNKQLRLMLKLGSSVTNVEYVF